MLYSVRNPPLCTELPVVNQCLGNIPLQVKFLFIQNLNLGTVGYISVFS